MFLKSTFKDNSTGTTLIELVTALGIVVVLIVAVLIIINPTEIQQRGRDEKRFSDIASLDRAINEYKLDNAAFPDAENITRYSDTLPIGNSGPVENSSDGWIDIDLTQYLVRLPTDPLNDTTYRYSYRHDQFSYELNAVLEFETSFMTDDGGDDVNFYELGNDLTIL